MANVIMQKSQRKFLIGYVTLTLAKDKVTSLTNMFWLLLATVNP